MDRKLNIIDCPGSDDFCGSLFSAFKVGDVGVFLFNAQNGWEVGSEIRARYARLLQKPVIGVVNQLDAEKASFEATVESIRASSRVKPVIVQYPVNQGPEFNAFIDVLLMKMYRFKDNDGHREELEIPAEELEKAQELNKELVEMAAEHDEALMELYFDKGTLTQDDIRSGLKIGVSKRDNAHLLHLGQARHRHQAPDGIHHQRGARSAEGPGIPLDRRRGDHGRRDRTRRSVRLQEPGGTAHRRDLLFPGHPQP